MDGRFNSCYCKHSFKDTSKCPGLFFSTEEPSFSSYHIDYSLDGNNWEKILDRKIILMLKKLIFISLIWLHIRLTVDTTTTGAFVPG